MVLCSFQNTHDRCPICDMWVVFYESMLWAVLYFYHCHAIKVIVDNYHYRLFNVHIKCHWVKYYWLPHMITPVSLNISVQRTGCSILRVIYFILRHKFRDKIIWSLATRKQQSWNTIKVAINAGNKRREYWIKDVFYCLCFLSFHQTQHVH